MIKIENVCYSYGKYNSVLQNISLTLEPGKIYGLLGENGVGKTTLLTLLCGLKKPQKGKITVTGIGAPFHRDPALLQSQYYLSDVCAPVKMTAIRYAQTYGKFWNNFSLEKFLELMKLFENDPDQRMDRMSSGQLKKVYICFALATAARYIYMDEPTNGLDIPSKSQFRRAIIDHISDDSTLVISTHQVRDLENIIDPIIILDRQDVLLNASLEQISQKLYFDYGDLFASKADGALYSEPCLGGSVSVHVNPDGRESKVNVEALFNAVHCHKAFIKGIFSI